MLHSLYNCGEKMALESGKQQRVRRSRALIFLKEEEGAQNFIYFFPQTKSRSHLSTPA